MRRFAIVLLLSLPAMIFVACEEFPEVKDKGGDNNQGTADVAAAAGSGSAASTGSSGAGGAGSSSSASSSGGGGDAGTNG